MRETLVNGLQKRKSKSFFNLQMNMILTLGIIGKLAMVTTTTNASEWQVEDATCAQLSLNFNVMNRYILEIKYII